MRMRARRETKRNVTMNGHRIAEKRGKATEKHIWKYTHRDKSDSIPHEDPIFHFTEACECECVRLIGTVYACKHSSKSSVYLFSEHKIDPKRNPFSWIVTVKRIDSVFFFGIFFHKWHTVTGNIRKTYLTSDRPFSFVSFCLFCEVENYQGKTKTNKLDGFDKWAYSMRFISIHEILRHFRILKSKVCPTFQMSFLLLHDCLNCCW